MFFIKLPVTYKKESTTYNEERAINLDKVLEVKPAGNNGDMSILQFDKGYVMIDMPYNALTQLLINLELL